MSFKTNLSCFSFTCSTQPEELTKRLKSSNKILLPPSVLYKLNQQQDLSDNIMFFKVSNKENAVWYCMWRARIFSTTWNLSCTISYNEQYWNQRRFIK